MSISLDLLQFDKVAGSVDAQMFGANYLFNRQDADSFSQLVGEMNISGARYPGGSITEHHFDMRNPDQMPASLDSIGQDRFTTLSEFLEACNTVGSHPTIVIPTRNALDSNGNVSAEYLADVGTFVQTVLDRVGEGKEFPDISIQAFEIGNEYWGSGNLTSAEYGEVADATSVLIQQILDDQVFLSGEPQILVQLGNPVMSSPDFVSGGPLDGLSAGSADAEALGLSASDFGADGSLRWMSKIRLVNEQIIGQLSPDARDAIDGLVEHYYYLQTGEDNPEYEMTSQATHFIGEKLDVWKSAGMEKDLALTEWNVHMSNYDQLGQVGAGTLINQFGHMVQMGATTAHIWPLQHNTANDLAGSFDEQPSLTPIGAAFSLLSQNVVGYDLLEVNENERDLELVSFSKGTQLKHFVISRTDETKSVTFLIADEGALPAEVNITRVYFESDNQHWLPTTGLTQTPGYLDHDAIAVVTEEIATVNADGTINVALRPYEVILIDYEAEAGVAAISGFRVISGTEDDDYLLAPDSNTTMFGLSGNDTLVGGDGNDRLFGGPGDDTLRGGAGDDYAFGGKGNDFILGGSGSDTLKGGAGNDTLYGGAGDDRLFGGSGRDFLNGGDGNDVLHGGNGNDEIWGGAGNDTIFGGAGADLLSGGAGQDVIRGGAGSDTIYGGTGADSLFGGGGNDLIVGGPGDDLIHGNGGNDSLYGGAGDDRLNGGWGEDWLSGGDGNDTLVSVHGSDTLEGGSGSDVFEIRESAAGRINIRDFKLSDEDQIRISKELLGDAFENKDLDKILGSVASTNEDGVLEITLMDGSVVIEVHGLDEQQDLESAITFF